MRERWEQLQPRERQLVAGMGVFFGLLLFYVLVWEPLHDGVEQAQQRVETQQDNLIWMQRSAARVILSRDTKPSAASKVSGSISQRINRTASQLNIKLSRIQPQKDEVNVRIDSVDFNSFMTWVQTLEKQRVAVVSADVSRGDLPGHVEVRKLLLRSL
ncbi:type II secretion system protein GspM [Echinimonas agarilytica]|uniref:Type II secretion system protein M n=1 Tax=Echinimonas agarilytica TaxID=1215918 RepID=A0AA41W8G2_9GAMM|nr:type II secretion system protein M [Echinimonas agarilytica]MCM2680885.1 type II secretion system protein M [Echinimonas agarilytica]